MGLGSLDSGLREESTKPLLAGFGKEFSGSLTSGLGRFSDVSAGCSAAGGSSVLPGINDRGCSGLLGAVGVDACESGMNLTEILVNSLGRAHECHSGMRFQCDECRSFCWTVLEPATLGVVYGAARYRQGGSVLGSPGEMVSDAFPYLW
uniref:Uncharacterized protein n=1 Tax=Ananas comosus var. bracteatus TaxID=296719 RepID=A0A6V7PLL0_ANACO|nr:unnamed protein product [Ananas comosus var. bracteatus]